MQPMRCRQAAHSGGGADLKKAGEAAEGHSDAACRCSQPWRKQVRVGHVGKWSTCGHAACSGGGADLGKPHMTSTHMCAPAQQRIVSRHRPGTPSVGPVGTSTVAARSNIYSLISPKTFGHVRVLRAAPDVQVGE